MKHLKDVAEQWSHEEKTQALLAMAEYAGLDVSNVELDGCAGHSGDCGKCVNGNWIPCSNPPKA